MGLTATNPSSSGSSNADLVKALTPTPIKGLSPLYNTAAESSAASGAAATPAPTGWAGVGGLLTSGYDIYKALQQNKQDVNMLGQIQQPASSAGNKYLSDALAGTLTPAESKQYQDLINQSKTLEAQAQPFIQQGTAGIAAAEAGQLPSWQQQQLDNATQAAIVQARASMGANVDSSSMAQIESQIMQQAQITKGQLAQQNLATYEQLYQLGATTQKEAFALLDTANQYVVADAQQKFQNAIAALGLANTAAMDKINVSLATDALLSKSIAQLFGGLTNASGKTALEAAGGKVMDAIRSLMGGDPDASLFKTTPTDFSTEYYRTDAGKAELAAMLGDTSTPVDTSTTATDFGSYMGDLSGSATPATDFTVTDYTGP